MRKMARAKKMGLLIRWRAWAQNVSLLGRWSWPDPRLRWIRAWWCGPRCWRNNPVVPWSPRWWSSLLLLAGWMTRMNETRSKSGLMMQTGMRSGEVPSSANSIFISIASSIVTIETTSSVMIATRFVGARRFAKIFRVCR